MKRTPAIASCSSRNSRAPSLALGVVACAISVSLNAAKPASPPFATVEVDRFVPASGVTFPFDVRSTLVDDIARELSVEFPTVVIVRQEDPTPYGQAVLRISGTVTEFTPGSPAKRRLLGFGAGAAVARAQVRWSDAGSGRALLIRELKGAISTGAPGGSSPETGDSLARKIVKLCNAARLVESH